MAETAKSESKPGTDGNHWFALAPADVARELSVGPDPGLTSSEATSRLQRNGPNALPAEKPPSTLRRFLGQYASYMQLILVGAAVVSLVIQQWATGFILIAITLLNAVIGLRPKGSARRVVGVAHSRSSSTASRRSRPSVTGRGLFRPDPRRPPEHRVEIAQ